jgi:transcriptional regulator with XRE-family HTH domain
MPKASEALRTVMEDYRIGQSELANAMGIRRSSVNNWVTGNRDPSGDTIRKIRNALESLNPNAAAEFIRLYLEN